MFHQRGFLYHASASVPCFDPCVPPCKEHGKNISSLFDQQPLLRTQVIASLRRELENLELEAHAAKESASEEEARRKEIQLEVDQLRCSSRRYFGDIFHFI